MPDFAFAAWRLPGREEISVSVCKNVVEPAPGSALPDSSGFFAAGFADNSARYWLPAEAGLQLNDAGQVLNRTYTADSPAYNSEAESFLDLLQASFHDALQTIPAGIFQLSQLPDAAEAELAGMHYRALVEKGVESIKAGRLRKVVPARKRSISFSGAFPLMRYFRLACRLYPNAFVYALHIPGKATWAGATPETLLSGKDGKLQTMALAATRRAKSDYFYKEKLPPAPDWTGKELEEQELVSEYIRDSFKHAGLPHFTETGPAEVQAGSLRHLRSRFETTGATDAQKTNLLNLLHPTSAVGGSPRQAALEFLEKNEDLDRGLYAGYIGPADVGNFSMFVNLRCIQVKGNEILLYAGAGLTGDSVPEQEYLETKAKMQTSVAVLKLL
ncbi:MAG: chorismate-binding protein [Bacteroidota bacterium]